jgi:hypothetical protein
MNGGIFPNKAEEATNAVKMNVNAFNFDPRMQQQQQQQQQQGDIFNSIGQP